MRWRAESSEYYFLLLQQAKHRLWRFLITSRERLRRAQVPIQETQYVFQSVHSLQIRDEGVYMGFAAVSDTRKSLDHQVHNWS
jgi:hypothetical protein